MHQPPTDQQILRPGAEAEQSPRAPWSTTSTPSTTSSAGTPALSAAERSDPGLAHVFGPPLNQVLVGGTAASRRAPGSGSDSIAASPGTTPSSSATAPSPATTSAPTVASATSPPPGSTSRQRSCAHVEALST